MTAKAKTTKKATFISNSRFQKGSGAYKCEGCGKMTRATGRGDCEHVRMCARCYDVAGWVNAVSDGECTVAEVPAEFRDEVAKEFPTEGIDC